MIKSDVVVKVKCEIVRGNVRTLNSDVKSPKLGTRKGTFTNDMG